MQTLYPDKLRIPRPVPIPIWTDDYTDIQKWIRKYHRYDHEEIWAANSEDSWRAFRSRHGYINFGLTYHQLRDKENNGYKTTPANSRAYQEQIKWEEEQRLERRKQQRIRDKEWEDIGEARAYWSKQNPYFGQHSFHKVIMNKTVKTKYGELVSGKMYWVPKFIRDQITRQE